MSVVRVLLTALDSSASLRGGAGVVAAEEKFSVATDQPVEAVAGRDEEALVGFIKQQGKHVPTHPRKDHRTSPSR